MLVPKARKGDRAQTQAVVSCGQAVDQAKVRGGPAARLRPLRNIVLLGALALAVSWRSWGPALVFQDLSATPAQFSEDEVASPHLRSPQRSGALVDAWWPCAVLGGTCKCTGTLVFSNLLGKALREVNADGEVQCSAEALGAPTSMLPKMCWCQAGLFWDEEVRKGLASMVRRGMVPRIEVASGEVDIDSGCDAKSDGKWSGCLTMSRRWDTTVVQHALVRTSQPEEQLDMILRKLDACHRLAPSSALRVLAVRSGQNDDVVQMPVSGSSVCSVVYQPGTGALWTAKKTGAHYCAAQPGTCTTTPCECKRSTDIKLELRTPQGQRCWACSEPGLEYRFRVNALAEQMEGTTLSWWPPSGINCPPILWAFMDWRACVKDCPAIALIMMALVCGLLMRKVEEFTGLVPWTRITPLFGPTLKRGEVWRFFTYTFFHIQIIELFQTGMTFLDALDVEGTPAIVLGDGSNLKCGVGAKQNYMCYPSIGIGYYHTIGVAVLSTMVAGMCSTWITFRAVVTGASALGFGLSGAIVALYGLYAGAELDQSTTVQRSFQDWVWLRLIFVGFHIAMEWIRSISQRDATGLFAHNAAFIAGFAYVLYFLPPMGDGTLLPSERPYIVPCAYDIHGDQFATSAVPECVRLFSQLYEYQVSDVQQKALLMFIATILFTAVNVLFFQRSVDSTEGMLLAGLEVSAVCRPCKREPGASNAWGRSNMEGKSIIVWCEVISGSRLQPAPDKGDWEPSVEVRYFRQRPEGLQSVAEVSRHTNPVPGSSAVEWKENLFLHLKFSRTGFIQVVLWDAHGSERVALGSALLPMSQAIRFNRQNFSEQRLRLQPVGESHGVDVSRALLTIRFRCLQVEEFSGFREKVKKSIDNSKRNIMMLEEQLRVRQMERASLNGDESAVAALVAAANADPRHPP